MTRWAGGPARISAELEGLSGPEEFRAACGECLSNAVPNDKLGWYDLDLASERVTQWSAPAERKVSDETLSQSLGAHPVLRSYQSRPAEGFPPRRVSDAISS